MVQVAPHSRCTMKCVADVADKAVSTEDLCLPLKRRRPEGGKDEAGGQGGGPMLDIIRLEAVLAALVQSKVISIKGAAAGDGRRHSTARPGGADDPAAGNLLSSSTVSSHKDGAPCHHHHHGRRKSRHHYYGHRDSDASGLLASGLFPKRRYRHRRRHHHHHLHQQELPPQFFQDEDELYQLQETAFCASTATLAPPTAGPSNGCASCCPSPTPSQSRIRRSHYDAEFIALNMDLEEEAFLSLHEEALGDQEAEPVMVHQRRRRRRRRKRGYEREGVRGLGARPKRTARVIDPEDLPKRARWTIIATACLLLLMSVLLVGVTLRMAPIIDEMVRKQNEQHQNSLSRDEGVSNGFFNASSNPAPPANNTASAHAL